MSIQLDCPCGTYLEAEDEDTLVAIVQAHLASEHPGHEYTREQILFIAY